MLFPTLPFLVFFLAVWGVVAALPARGRPGFLLAASFVFYGLWYPAYLALLGVAIVANYLLLRRIEDGPRPRLALAGSVIFTLGLLGVFKYAGFAAEIVSLVAAPVPAPELFLPLGISFYSFQIVGLAVDRHRGRGPSPASLGEYALFVCFFPQLIAGPILRGGQLLPQLATGGHRTPERTRRGVWLLVAGLLKKVVFADLLLAPYVDLVFGAPGHGGAAVHWVAAYGFAFQIYFDFAGYTDMARGLAALLGFELPPNFREPYLARDPSEFWRRWHMTLSQWLRDYLYVPLGGNRGGPLRTGLHLWLTMLLGGLWHGAAWGFLIWGAIHGTLLVAHRALGARRDPDRPLVLSDAPRVLLCFTAISLALVVFRLPEPGRALVFFDGLRGAGGGGGLPVVPLALVVASAALHGFERWARPRAQGWCRRCAATARGRLVEGVVIGVALALVFGAAGARSSFIYFQF